MAKRFGVTRYPAFFVDDILVATPNDFGFYGRDEKEEGGRYSPLKSVEAHQRFQGDLKKMIELLLAGKKGLARAAAKPSEARTIAAYPAIKITDLEGKTLAPEELRGRVVLVELWATWCPPCRSTLRWLGELTKKYPREELAIVALAVESQKAEVLEARDQLASPLNFVMATPELARAFGDVSAVPTILVFDQRGQTSAVFFGAPPTLHDEVEAKLRELMRLHKP